MFELQHLQYQDYRQLPATNNTLAELLSTTTQTFSRLANAARPAQPSLLSPSPHVTRDSDDDSDDDYNDNNDD